ncbi:hypothetical protein JCM21142_104306 [Saccharicrinis fermentans DSM 9555 = JCM 21142]|uniref:MmeI-like DNA-methyltransferase domain-containing protein n=1 Tax=Saccharicrinis fermentans DSM 9555 = JCM 21142 TaxID=869213 RepID=W7YLT7_9BACT|nr:hypothetical protein JCM21142_104306 [Saccharicrinis fermentans DSM 9555 = JCM 21142]
MQDKEQKSDMEFVFGGMENYKKQDYISCWFYKSAKYIRKGIKCAFVSTNSICQGTQVEMTWPHIFNMGIEIYFTHKDFVWTNSAKNKAGVICSIIGLRGKNNEPKYIFNNGIQSNVNNINAYLANARNTIVYKRSKPLATLLK